MDITQIVMLILVFMCGLLTGFHIGKEPLDKSSSQSKKNVENTCPHDSAIVRPELSPNDGSLLICEKCGADFGNFHN